MSFFKKLKDGLKEMLHDDYDKDKQKQDPQKTDHPATDQHRDFDQNSNIYGQYPPYCQPPGPQLPPGWIAQWDGTSQRWYYLEQATGRTQWELWNVPPGGAGTPEFQQGYGHAMPAVPHMQGQGEHSREYYTDSGSGGQQKKGSGMRGKVAAGLGGAAIGAIAGHALGDSDSDDGAHAAPTGATPYAAPPGEPPLEYNPELSSSQRSSLQEAREDLEEARAEVAEDSDPSSSDVEDLREAQEEYASEVESAQEELEA
ncbi:hypothetical protein LTR96_005716 [Exophiala xenobiotica]|nr:hypothetical protein H2202_001716 [Exophiala xenobiotica]KAK5198094.1 hypothetical protein LTR92_002339 [Exophiala xenobiotica]KAK5210430.1 hypothetical protein LTR41_004098 [Exophiala xenobiotica]KAK5238575.1 hypothetical protein LTR47_000318 [Exophiala xenobiotica]KAK5246216.1 hypothetical protein LTS06_008451 [Exophiala xenobiotica]